MTFDQADYFHVPLLDGRFGIGQVLETGANEAGAAFCGLTLKIAAPGVAVQPLTLNDIVAFVLVDPGQFTAGHWLLGGFDQIPRFASVYNYAANKALGFPDTPQHDPAIIEAYLSACHGLYPWSAFGDLFDKIHRADVPRPEAANG